MKRSVILPALVLVGLACTAFLGAGEMQTRSLQSAALGQEVKINVLLPDDYAASGDKRYPVVYLLHGYGGDYSEWTRVGVADRTQGLSVILAMPEGDKSFYVNHYQDPKGRWEDYIAQDVVSWIDANYRSIPRAEGRAICGLSMGGYGAMVVGLRHPELFRSIASHSGALGVPGGLRDGEIGERLRKIFGPDDSAERTKYDLVRLATDLKPELRPHLYIDCGSGDFLLESNRKFVADLARLKVPYEYREVPGGHTFEYWKLNVRYSLERQSEALAEALKKPPAAPPAPAVALTGEWKVTSATANGESSHPLYLKQDGAKISGHAELQSRKVDLSRGSFSNEELVFEADVDRDNFKGVIKVVATRKNGQLQGTWKLLREGGDEAFSGGWRAELVSGPAKPGGNPLVGEWDLETETSGDKRDYSLRVEEKEGKLVITWISPRSGEKPTLAAEAKEGKLHFEVERDIAGTAVTLVFDGKLENGQYAGKVVPRGFEAYEGTWTAKRKATKKAEDL